MVQNPWSLDVFMKAAQQADAVIRTEPQPPQTLQFQIFKAATSVAANLAEFCALEKFGSKSEKLLRCLAENNETMYWLYVWHTHFALDEAAYRQLIDNNTVIGKKLFSLLRAVEEAEYTNHQRKAWG